MSERGGTTCPTCGAPLPACVGGARVLCGWCGAQARLAAPPAARRLLLADAGDQAEAAALLRQHLAARYRAPAAVRGGGPSRWAPFWSVATVAGAIVCGPATRSHQALLRRVTLPPLPARPLAASEAPPADSDPADVPLEAFLAAAPGGKAIAATEVEQAWLVWVPLRHWQVRLGARWCEAATVADLPTPVLADAPPSDPPLRPRWGVLAPLAAYAASLVALGRLLPLPLHVPAAACLWIGALGAWRGGTPRRAATATARITDPRERS